MSRPAASRTARLQSGRSHPASSTQISRSLRLHRRPGVVHRVGERFEDQHQAARPPARPRVTPHAGDRHEAGRGRHVGSDHGFAQVAGPPHLVEQRGVRTQAAHAVPDDDVTLVAPRARTATPSSDVAVLAAGELRRGAVCARRGRGRRSSRRPTAAGPPTPSPHRCARAPPARRCAAPRSSARCRDVHARRRPSPQAPCAWPRVGPCQPVGSIGTGSTRPDGGAPDSPRAVAHAGGSPRRTAANPRSATCGQPE